MDEKYYIRSNKYSTQERQTKRGRVYDVLFRIVTVDGIEKQKKLSGYKTKSAAKEAYLEFVENYCEYKKGAALKSIIAPEDDATTIKDLIPLYLAAIQNQNKESTIYDKTHILNSIILPQLGDCRLSELTKERLLRWQDELWATRNPKTNEFYSHARLSNVRAVLSSLLSWISDRYPFNNPMPQIKKPKRRVSKTQMQFWTRAEFEQFISVVDNATFRAIFNMLFFTGRRKGEVIVYIVIFIYYI